MNANEKNFDARNLSTARDFTRHLTELLRKEQGAMVSFLLALAECDGRRLWADLGYASLFDYLHRELGLSRSAAYYRAAAAGLVQRYPEVADALADGRLCLSTVGEVGKVITPANIGDVLPRFFHLSAREAREVVAELAPRPTPPLREVVTSFRAEPVRSAASPSTSAVSADATRDATHSVLTSGQIDPGQVCGSVFPIHDPERSPEPVEATPVLTPIRPVREQVEPLTANLRRIHFTVSKRWMEKLDAARAALSHSIPSGSAEEVIDAAFDALLEREAKKKGLLVKKPRRPAEAIRTSTTGPSVPTLSANGMGGSVDPIRTSAALPSAGTAGANGSDRRKALPARVRREVMIRDAGKCQAKLHDGTICGSKVRLQLDHATPAALGGPPTVENIQLRCERHNQLAAREVFGESLMELFAAGGRG